MSKITNDGLTRSGTECFFIAVPMPTAGVKGLTIRPISTLENLVSSSRAR